MKKIVIVSQTDFLSLTQLKTLAGILKNHYDISILTGSFEHLTDIEKDLVDNISKDGIPFLNSFKEWSIFELMKLMPHLFQQKPDIFHFIIQDELTKKQWVLLLSFAYFIKTIPGSQISITNFAKPNWWLSQLLQLASIQIPLEKNTLWSTIEKSKLQIRNTNSRNNDSAIEKNSKVLVTKDSILSSADQWLIPFPISDISDKGLDFFYEILHNFNFKLIIRGWGNTSLFDQNKIRLRFQRYINRLIIYPFSDEEMMSEVVKSRGIILYGNKHELQWSDQDIYFFINKYRATFLIERNKIVTLESYWKNGDTHWELDEDNPMASFKEIILQNLKLQFTGVEKIVQIRNQSENKILRAFNLIPNKSFYEKT